jgi:hypothetical protein
VMHHNQGVPKQEHIACKFCDDARSHMEDTR